MDFYKFCQSKMPNIFIDSDILLKDICEKMENKINNTNKMLFINCEHFKFSTELSVLWVAWLNVNGNNWTAHLSHTANMKRYAISIYKSFKINKRTDQFVFIIGTMLGFDGVIINNSLSANYGWTNYELEYMFKNNIISRITGKYPLICFYNNADNEVLDLIKEDLIEHMEFYL